MNYYQFRCIKCSSEFYSIEWDVTILCCNVSMVYYKQFYTPIEESMTNESFKDIFNKTKQSFTEQFKDKPNSELKDYLVNFIVETEKKAYEEFQSNRAKVSAALSLIDDDETRIKVNRRLKEAKVSPTAEQMNLRTDRPLEKQGKEKKEPSQDQLIRSAILAVKKIPGMTPESIFGMLKARYSQLTLEIVKDLMR